METNGAQLLIDTVAEVNIVPSTTLKKDTPSPKLKLQAASRSEIKAYNTKQLRLHFGLKSNFLWSFIVADTPIPIIGVDFLQIFSSIFQFSILDAGSMV